MNAKIQRRVTAVAAPSAITVDDRAKKETIRIIGFDAERFRAPFTLRCAALLLDYLLIMIAPVLGFMIANTSGETGLKLFRHPAISIGWTIALLVLIVNFVALPLLFGRTLGKFLTGLRVVQQNGADLSLGKTALRHLIGYPITILTVGIGFLIAIFNDKGLALHDLIAKTIVVQAARRQTQIVKK